jgi:hypothetical protein
VIETELQNAKNIRDLQLEAGVESSALEYELLPHDIQNAIKLKDNNFLKKIIQPRYLYSFDRTGNHIQNE